MDFEEIKEIVEADGGKFIIVENGKPVMVIVSFEDYKNKLTRAHNVLCASVKSKIKKIQKPMPKELQEEDLKIEDLPL